MRTRTALALVLAVPLLHACSSTSGSSESPDASTDDATSSDATFADASSGTIPCDVNSVLTRICQQCHSNPPRFGALMPLVTYADLVAPAKTDPTKHVYEMIEKRIHDDGNPMPPAPNPRLSAADTATFDAWIAAGAPSGGNTACISTDGGTKDASQDSSTPTDSGGGGDTGTDSSINPSCPNLHITPGSPWQMPQASGDQYVCYGFDVTESQKQHIISLAPKIDNATILHHLVLFESDTGMSSTPTPCQYAQSVGWRVVYAWAPGAGSLDLPPQAGLPLTGTTHFIMQVHYSNPNALSGQVDSSGMDLCTTDQLRPNDADVLAFGSIQFTVPPHGTLDWTCNYTIPQQLDGVHAFSAIPHMHQIGKSIATVQLPGGSGTPVDLGAQPNWNFQTQNWFPITADLKANDVVSTRCVWQNAGSSAVSFGPNTSDEMCFSYTMYYPAVPNGGFPWITPASAPGICGVTP
jgi:hypothetical protein